MPHLGLPQHLSFCDTGTHLVFLDVRNDRYFRLGMKLESAFSRYVAGTRIGNHELGALVERGLLVARDASAPDVDTPMFEPCTASLVDSPDLRMRVTPRIVLEVAVLVIGTQVQLRFRSFHGLLSNGLDLRNRLAPQRAVDACVDPRLRETVAAFFAARPHVPIETCCLLDSLCLLRFLARRGFHADLVFGVTGEPFSAHCWLQRGTTVLNDSVDHAAAHVPIRRA